MSTQPEPATEAGRALLERQSDPDWMDLDYPPKLAAILAIEQEATAAARAEVARQIEAVYIAYAKPPTTHDFCRLCKGRNFGDGPVQHYDKCPVTLALLEDAAPRQPNEYSGITNYPTPGDDERAAARPPEVNTEGDGGVCIHGARHTEPCDECGLGYITRVPAATEAERE